MNKLETAMEQIENEKKMLLAKQKMDMKKEAMKEQIKSLQMQEKQIEKNANAMANMIAKNPSPEPVPIPSANITAPVSLAMERGASHVSGQIRSSAPLKQASPGFSQANQSLVTNTTDADNSVGVPTDSQVAKDAVTPEELLEKDKHLRERGLVDDTLLS